MAEVHVTPDRGTEVAQQLLAAAKELGLPLSVVQTSSSGLFGLSFLVPDEVFLKANGVTEEDVDAVDAEPEEPVEESKPKRKPGRPKKVTAPVEEVTDGE